MPSRRVMIVGVLSLGCTLSLVAFPLPDSARIGEIEAVLEERPSVCTPSGDKKYDCGDEATCLARARSLVSRSPKRFPYEDYKAFYVTGERKKFEAWRKQVVQDFEILREAERIEKSGQYVGTIASYLEAMIAWPSWTSPAYDKSLAESRTERIVIDLLSSDLAVRIAETLSEIGDSLPEALVDRVKGELNRRIFTPYLAVAAERSRDSGWRRGNWWFNAYNNWNAVCHSCCVRAALAILPEKRQRAQVIEAAERALDAYFSGFAQDGYCSEGIGYWNYGYGHYLSMGLAVRKATKGAVDFFKHPCAKLVMRFPLAYQLQKGYSPQFSDGGGNPRQHVLDWGRMVWPDLADEIDGELPLRDVFPNGQVWIFRSTCSEPRPFGFAVKGGHNEELHNHNDVGSWMLMLDGAAIAGDPGGEVYTRRTFSKDRYQSNVLNSYGHPVPRIAGGLQGLGRRYRARVLSTEFSDAMDAVELDCSEAYDGLAAGSFVRRVVFDREHHTVAMTDRFRFSSPQMIDDPIVTYSNIRPTDDPYCFLLADQADETKTVEVAVSVKGGEGTLKSELIDNPGCASPRRLSFSLTKPVAAADVIWTFSIPDLKADANSLGGMVEVCAKLREGETLNIPKGTYRLGFDSVKQMMLEPSNNENGLKRVAFPLVNKRNITIDGNESELVVANGVFPFAVTNCQGVTLRNFSIRNEHSGLVQFKIDAKDDDGFSIRLESDTKYRIFNGDIEFLLPSGMWAFVKTLSFHSLDRMRIRYVLTASGVEDKDKLAAKFMTTRARELSPGVIRFDYREDDHPKFQKCAFDVGETLTFALGVRRACIAMYFENCRDVTVENVSVSRFVGMGLAAQLCSNVTVRAYSTKPFGNDRVTTTADDMMFTCCEGDILVEGCSVRDSQDDGCNVHGNYHVIESVAGCRVSLRAMHPEQRGFYPYRPGDGIDVISTNDCSVLYSAKVVGLVSRTASGEIGVVMLDRELPSEAIGMLVENTNLSPDVIVRNNTFVNVPHVRLSGRGKIFVQDNVFRKLSGGLLATDLIDYWYEYGRIGEMTVQDNLFEDTPNPFCSGVNRWRYGDESVPEIHGKLRMSGNRFRGNTGKIKVGGFKEVEIVE